jgi:hypothetical protein
MKETLPLSRACSKNSVGVLALREIIAEMTPELVGLAFFI